MAKGLSAKAGAALSVLGVLVLAGCASPGESGGMGIGEMLMTGGATLAPVQTTPTADVYCPPVTVFEGGSAIQAYAGGRTGDASALRSQIAISNLARECAGQPDGSTLVKVGVEARALLGAGGGAGRYNVPVQVVVKGRSGVIATRSRTGVAAIPAGGTQASVTVVEEGILVPASQANEFEIEVGLGGRQGRRG
ncbi:hypothetical protein MHY87_05385 [Microvirga sp. ACRRW]|uniref:hypothetical protein n=1 Tax=Microvirga sp. ACRRW TaxID=2918205 RepID=UPI001EF6ED8C|nr:hypothetical protein [Microvirga sp. ACRRW]MCG7392333.1 hypothetical protein [Microvirga sp. ACRRW]